MELKDIRINPVAIDNEPFIRSLTAVLEASFFNDSLSGVSYTPVTGTETFAWYFPDESFATDATGKLYKKGTVLPASNISTLIVYFSAEKYNFLTEEYELNVLPLCAVAEFDTATYELLYDTYPDIDLTFLINHEPAINDITFYEALTTVTVDTTAAIGFINNLSGISLSPDNFTFFDRDDNKTDFTFNVYTGPKNYFTYFYRLTSQSAYQANLKIQSNNYTFSADCFDARYSLNRLSFWETKIQTPIDVYAPGISASFINSVIATEPNYVPNSALIVNSSTLSYKVYTSNTLTPLITTTHFITRNLNTQTGRTSSVYLTLSANTPPNSFKPWYSAHRVTRALSAVFVPYWLSAGEIIAWPKQYFANSYDLPTQLNTTNAVLCSPGLAFFGEGHTEYIYLSTQPARRLFGQPAVQYNWLFDDFTDELKSKTSSTTQFITAVVAVSTEMGFYPRIPIELQVTDSVFNLDAPKFYYDDTTGISKRYPYYQSSIDRNGNEDPTNNRLRQSIFVKPYDLSPTNFDPGSDAIIYLPVNNTPLEYTATLQSSLSVGLSSVDRCYDKFGFLWKWTALDRNDRFGNLATTWATVQSAISAGSLSTPAPRGPYPKLWRKEGGLSADFFNYSPIFCSAGPVTWTLSTDNWSNTFIDPLTAGLSGIEDQRKISDFDYSLRLLNDGELLYTLPYRDNEEVILNAQRTFYSIICAAPYDWNLKIEPVSFTQKILSIAPPEVKLYTPNFYALTGTPIKFENVTTRPDLISALKLTFDNDASIRSVILYPPDISNDIIVTYKFAGAKTIRAEAYINYTDINTTVLPFRFNNIVQIVENYDEVDSNLYRSPNEPLILPYINKTVIQPNETVLADAFNFNVEKIYRNLQYLENRGYGYLNAASRYYGWLGNPFPYYSSKSPFYQMPPLSTVVIETIETRQPPKIEKIVVSPEQKLVITDTITKTDVISLTSYREETSIDRITITTPPVNPKYKPTYTWADLNCNINPKLNITWQSSCIVKPSTQTDVLTSITITRPVITQETRTTTTVVTTDIQIIPEQSVFNLHSTWNVQTLSTVRVDPTCFGLYEQQWRWKSRTTERAGIPITWEQTKFDNLYPKRWYYEGSGNVEPVACDEGYWNTFVAGLNKYYDPIPMCDSQERCNYTGIASKNNILFLTHKTAFRVLSSDYTATYFEGRRTIDDLNVYGDLKNVCINSKDQIIVLDGLRSEVCVYNSKYNNYDDLKLFNSWGGFGSSLAKNKFNDPTDLHVDQYDNIWVTDSSNYCVKCYSSTGAWIQTIITDSNRALKPISMCVDSQNNIHVLTRDDIRMFTSTGDFIKSYDYFRTTRRRARRINTSYNREMIYLCTDRQVVKFFRTGVISGFILRSKQCVTNITGIYQDEYRNLLITSNNRVLKYVDPMIINPLKGPLPPYYWKLEDVLIHPEEYVQNWVYNKALQRLWDNIEYFRSTLFYLNTPNNPCKQFRPPVHQKEDILIHQNEIVSSGVLNRVLGYLWENYETLIDYFDPGCPDRFGRINI
jgi:hypothetical protein